MYTAEALADLHERSHLSLAKLLSHCGALGPEEFERELPGFGIPSVRLQLDHVIGAEKYWVGVLLGRMDVDRDGPDPMTVDALEEWRRNVFSATEDYLRSASEPELNTPRPMMTWGGKEQRLMPARVILRTQTHLYQHQGQMVAMCRLLGKPADGLDFPIV